MNEKKFGRINQKHLMRYEENKIPVEVTRIQELTRFQPNKIPVWSEIPLGLGQNSDLC